jgi:hypothetical protein
MNSERSIGTGAHCRIGLKSNSELVRFQANYASGKQRTVGRIATTHASRQDELGNL